MDEEKKKISKAQMNAVAKYTKANYDELKIRVPKGQKEEIKEYADSLGKSVNQFISDLINAEIHK